MAIGFMSFGGMLTGGDDAAQPETETVQVQDQPETKDVSLVKEENNTEENGMSDMEQKTLANNTINE